MKNSLSPKLPIIVIAIIALGMIGAVGMYFIVVPEAPPNIGTESQSDIRGSLALDTRPFMPADYQGAVEPNLDPSNTTVDYENADIGLRFKVPYNPQWGNAEYQVHPYTEQRVSNEKFAVQFGPSFPFEGGGWARGVTIFTEPAATAEDTIARIKEEESDFLEDRPFETLTVSGKQVVVYYSGGLCSYVNLQVIGERYNYALWPTCGDSGEIRNELLRVVNSMEFIGGVAWTGERTYMPDRYDEHAETEELSPNRDPATERVEYTDKEWKFRVQIPYNPAWGNTHYKVHPYEAADLDGDGKTDVIAFGTSAPGEGGGWGRWRTLSILPYLSKEDTLKKLKQNEDAPKNIKVVDLGNLEAITYELTSVMGGPTSEVVVVGKNANYLIATPFGLADDLLTVARSIREE